MLHKKVLTVGPLGTQCYLIWADGRDDCVVIDPGFEPEKIRAALSGRRIAAILLTHGHFDHIGGVRALMDQDTALVIHALDAPMLSDPELNAGYLINTTVTAPQPTHLVAEGDEVTYGGVSLRVLHTPGHTPGSVCYLAEPWLFTGDTLFHGGYGRTDLPGGSMTQLRASLRRLMSLIPQWEVLPGHA